MQLNYLRKYIQMSHEMAEEQIWMLGQLIGHVLHDVDDFGHRDGFLVEFRLSIRKMC